MNILLQNYDENEVVKQLKHTIHLGVKKFINSEKIDNTLIASSHAELCKVVLSALFLIFKCTSAM